MDSLIKFAIRNFEKIFNCKTSYANDKLKSEFEALILTKNFNWLENDSCDRIIARLLTLTEFNNKVEEDEELKKQFLEEIKKIGLTYESAREWRTNTITKYQLMNVVGKYLFNGLEIVYALLNIIQCSFETSKLRYTAYNGAFNSYFSLDKERGYKQDFENMFSVISDNYGCILNSMNKNNELLMDDPYYESRSDNWERERFVYKAIHQLRIDIKRLLKIRNESEEQWTYIRDRLIECVNKRQTRFEKFNSEHKI